MRFIPVCKLCQIPHSTVTTLMERRMGQPAEALRGEPGTVRMIIPVNVSGEALRLEFHNADTVPGHLTCVTVARCDVDGRIDESSTVEAVHELDVAPGKSVYSDSILFSVEAGTHIAVSVYCRTFQSSTGGIDPLMRQSPAGDFCGANYDDTDPTPPALKAQGQRHYPQIPLLARVEVYTQDTPKVVVCLGDSITQQGHWFTVLQKRLYKAYPGQVLFLNAGIGGNRLLRDCPARLGGLFGDAGMKRLNRDVLEVSGVTHMILALGINDIMHSEGMMAMLDPAPAPTVEAFGQACKEMVQKTGERGIRAMAFTLYPARLSENEEKKREFQALYHGYNAAIERAGFAHVLNTQEILGAEEGEGYRSGLCRPDCLHLNEAGGEVLGNAVPLSWCVEQ